MELLIFDKDFSRPASGSFSMQRIVIFANPIAGKGRGRRLRNAPGAVPARGLGARVLLQHPASATDAVMVGITAAVSIARWNPAQRGRARHQCGQNPGRAFWSCRWNRQPHGPPSGIALSAKASKTGPCGPSHGRIVHLIQASCGPRRLVRLGEGPFPARACSYSWWGGPRWRDRSSLDRVRKGPIRFTSYLKPSLATLAGYSYPRIEVEIDGRLIWPMRQGVA